MPRGHRCHGVHYTLLIFHTVQSSTRLSRECMQFLELSTGYSGSSQVGVLFPKYFRNNFLKPSSQGPLLERILRATFDPRGLGFYEFKGHVLTSRAGESRTKLSMVRIRLCGVTRPFHFSPFPFFARAHWGAGAEMNLVMYRLAHEIEIAGLPQV